MSGPEPAPALSPELASRVFFTAGGAIETALLLVKARLRTYLALFAIVTVPSLVIAAASLLQLRAVVSSAAGSGVTLVVQLSGLIMIMALAIYGPAATHVTIEHLRGRDPSAIASLGFAVRRVLPAAAVGLLATVCIGVGLVALVVPGIIAMLALSLVIPIAVVERRGLIGALRRSAVLTRGYRTSLLAIGIGFVVLCAAAWLCVLVVTFFVALGLEVLPGSAAAGATLPLSVLTVLALCFGPLVLQPVLLGVAYHELAGVPDDREQLADVFA